MDWINQNKFKSWLIAFLVVVNLVTLSLFWIYTSKDRETPPKQQSKGGSESINLMKKVLDLNSDQTDRLEKMQTNKVEQIKLRNDSLTTLKKLLAEELFKDKPDTSAAKIFALEIGRLQTEVELLRFEHFNDLISICSPEQKEKLKPVLVEFFGKKPPKDIPKEGKDVKPDKQRKEPPEKKIEEERPDAKQDSPKKVRPAPPSIDEKVAKYVNRLNLTPDQTEKIRQIFIRSNQKGEQLRNQKMNDRETREAEKQKIRNEEDAAVMEILDSDQKIEFQKMLQKRRNQTL
ncbi:MAG: periplasmic heavy metal sensor [Ignavibacteria bacterium]|nr:periplasmic heavy metal sensor [Ignavibacteria bacterium]